ncbi:hypothetical protein EMPS_05900 [Entomortierella parvispora]|uniref:Anaphase-promoting complex subunit 4 WD40 domain-containing protein n=1 Tax=Entomortierella parvispora TaxID=205924 RepID=A0A9P3HBE9_9FUNG|nr:hypothetical protein EMPS_05900 [Entomortierella parvispora]
MSPSLPPPPRKLSSSSSTGGHSNSHRYPKINPNATAAAADPSYLSDNAEDDEQLDRALAELLGDTRLSGGAGQSANHLPHCKHHGHGGARPLSIASVSSLGSGSYSSFGSTHSRRVSQAYLSPLSPTLSEPCSSTSYFSTLPEEEGEEFKGMGGEGDDDASLLSTSHQDMSMAASSLPSCTYCSSVRSNSICSAGTQDNQNSLINNNHNIDNLDTNNALRLGLRSTASTSTSSSSSHATSGTTITSTKTTTAFNHRHSMQAQQFFEQSRLAVLREQIPTEIRHRLTYHLDECWFVHFSPSGDYLASTGLDQTIMIWQDVMTPEPRIYKKFEYSRSVTHVEWSPDSKYLLVNLGFDAISVTYTPEFYVIDIATGEVVLTTRHNDGSQDIHVNAIGWLPDSQRFVTAPQSGLIAIWNLKGEVVDEISIGDKKTVVKLCMIPERNEAVVCTNELTIEVLSFDTKETKFVERLSDMATSIMVSPNRAFLSVSVKGDAQLCRPAQILIYDLELLEHMRALEAETYENGIFIIMPGFCGPNDEILCSGSENGKLNFWDVETGEIIAVSEEHSKHSGWVSFHPTTPGMMASCSDDNHIIIWVTKDLSSALQDEDERWMENRRSTVTLPKINLKKGW